MTFDIKKFLTVTDLAPPAPGTPLADLPAYRVAKVAVGAAVFDGELDLDEDEDLLAQLQSLPGLAEIDGSNLNDLVAEVVGAGDELPDDFETAFVAGFAKLARELESPALRRAAYELAVHFAAWDDELSESETKMLGAMATAFDIGPDEAAKLESAVLAE